MLNNAVELPLSLPAVNTKTNEDEVALQGQNPKTQQPKPVKLFILALPGVF